MIAPSVGDILTHHVKLSVEGINRMYLNVYVPRLQAHAEQGIVHFFREHRRPPLPSVALMKPMSPSFVEVLEGFVTQHKIPHVQFPKGSAMTRLWQSICLNSGRKKGWCCRQGPGEDAGVPHRKAQEPEDGLALSVDRG
jgi:hypothetical protein